MSFPVQILDTPLQPGYKLPALATSAPSVGSTPHGIVGPAGKVSITHNNATTTTFTLYYWCNITGSWLLPAPSAVLSQVTVDQNATGTIKAPVGTRIFIQADQALDGSTADQLVHIGGIQTPTQNQNYVV